LSVAERRAAQLPPLAPDCAPDGREASAALRIEGLNDGATLARAPGSDKPASVHLRALGTETEVQWLLDGRWIGLTRGTRGFEHGFEQPGEHTLTALADSGAWSTLRFRVLR
ncbi:penicillin-binding protein 1C, partial [Pseudoxanthomonas sp. X-1]